MGRVDFRSRLAPLDPAVQLCSGARIPGALCFDVAGICEKWKKWSSKKKKLYPDTVDIIYQKNAADSIKLVSPPL